LNQQYELETKRDNEQRTFLSQNGLPQSLHAITATNSIPEPVWEKIEDFQKKGAIQNVEGMITGVAALKDNNLSQIK